ncbi:kinase-like domain-containing protein [Chlamydoabsidia padenii]|nr:kinase-like domain-containing protein [Chlamydoabsidia padenii]
MGFFHSMIQSNNNAKRRMTTHPSTQQDKTSSSSKATTQQKDPPPTTTTYQSTNIQRFQLYPDGTHSHHLTMPAPSRLTGLVDGLLHGGGEMGLRLAHHKKPEDEQVQKERAAIDAALNRPPSCTSFAQKWGACHQVIGRGAFGVVRVVHKKETAGTKEQLYAVKEFRKRSSEMTSSYVKRLTSEFCIGSSLKHTNIIEILDLLPLTDTSLVYCQVMGYCDGGDLFHLIYESSCTRGLELVEANCLFKQLIRGVDYMHRNGIAHRDLKPENLLLTSTGCLKISDFGSAACFLQHDANIIKSHGLVGSEPYIAPEEFTQEEYDARKVDIWSCGIIYMAMRTGSHLWRVAKQGEDDIYDRYLKFRRLVEEEKEKARRERQQDNMDKDTCLIKAKEIVKKKSKECGYDVLEDLEMASKKLVYRLLDPSADKRILTPDILKCDWFAKIQSCQSD